MNPSDLTEGLRSLFRAFGKTSQAQADEYAEVLAEEWTCDRCARMTLLDGRKREKFPFIGQLMKDYRLMAHYSHEAHSAPMIEGDARVYDMRRSPCDDDLPEAEWLAAEKDRTAAIEWWRKRVKTEKVRAGKRS